MDQTLSRLLGSGVLSPEQTEFALKDLEAHRRNFDAGDQVIREGGRLTPLGAEVIESARTYIARPSNRRALQQSGVPSSPSEPCAE